MRASLGISPPMNRTDRLVAIVMVMQGRRLIRAEDLAEQFEVSVRTVYRDIDALCEAGVPITGEAGVGYSLVKGYHLPPVMLTADEASALFVGAELAKQLTDKSLAGPVTQALDKLRAILPRERKQQLETLGRRMVVYARRPKPLDSQPDERGLLAVQEAVVSQRVLKLCYKGREDDQGVHRAVEPLGVVFYSGAWTLVAWCRLRKDIRHFRIDRMEQIELQGETFATRDDFDLKSHFEEQDRAAKLETAKVWFGKYVVERARMESMATLMKERDRDGGTEFSLATWSLDWLARWILSFGREAEGIEPPSLRVKIAREAKAIAEKHV